MKNNSIFLSLAFLIISLVGCKNDDVVAPQPEQPKTMEIVVSRDENTRTALFDGSLQWTEGDAISINGVKYTLKPGSIETGGKRAIFTGAAVETPYVAYYPYSASAITMDVPNNIINTNITVPTMQTYRENSVGIGAYPMYAEAGFDSEISFSDAPYGILKITLTGEETKKIKNIVISGVYVNGGGIGYSYSGCDTVWHTNWQPYSGTITLDCSKEDGGGVALNSTGVCFYIVIPTRYKSTDYVFPSSTTTPSPTPKLGVTINATDKSSLKKTISGTIKKNTILKMPTLTYDVAAPATGRVDTIQRATDGNGVNLFFTADGYTAAENVENGTTRNLLDNAYEGFFDTEPYKSLKSYFNVYFVYADSPEGGYFFESTFTNDSSGRGFEMNDSKCGEFIKNSTDIDPTGCVTIIAVKRKNEWADARSVCSMSSNGTAYAHVLTEVGMDVFKRTVQHEAGGHGFANLADEYVEPGNTGSIFDSNNSDWLAKYKERADGWYCNVYLNPEKLSGETCKWQNLIDNYSARYTGLKATDFEGGYYCVSDVYRPASTSIMTETKISGNHLATVEYFNAPSRAEIYKRIMKRSGEKADATDADFVGFEISKGINITQREPMQTQRGGEVKYIYGAAPKVVEVK